MVEMSKVRRHGFPQGKCLSLEKNSLEVSYGILTLLTKFVWESLNADASVYEQCFFSTTSNLLTKFYLDTYFFIFPTSGHGTNN